MFGKNTACSKPTCIEIAEANYKHLRIDDQNLELKIKHLHYKMDALLQYLDLSYSLGNRRVYKIHRCEECNHEVAEVQEKNDAG